MKTKIYITGGSGLVGRNIIENLNPDKYDILTIDISELNLLNYLDVVRFLEQNKPDVVLHCAGKVGGIQSNILDPYGYYTENILMGVHLVKASKELGIKKFLNLSSSCSYPYDAPNPLTEDLCFAGRLEPTNEGYAIAKASILKMCTYVTKQFEGFMYKTLVPCNLYGKYDKFGEKNSHMIPGVIRKLHFAKENNTPSVEIWGDGTARREFMFATDLGIMISEILDRFDEMPEVMNIGLGYDYSVDDYYKTIAKIVGYTGEFTHDLTKPAGMKQKLLDISKQTAFGIKPKHTLEEGVRETYKYFLENELK